MEAEYERIKAIVEKELSCSAHDIDHVLRVYNMCVHLAEGEPHIDLQCLKAAALLHDIARVREDTDPAGEIDHAVLGAEMADTILTGFKYPPEKRECVSHCIRAHRFRSGCSPQTSEAKILFDADKLDVLGAVGVARCFMLAGQYNERIYVRRSLDEYVEENLLAKSSRGRIKDFPKHAPNIEFELKFKHIPEMLYTKKAQKMAEHRFQVMFQFFEQLEQEINGTV